MLRLRPWGLSLGLLLFVVSPLSAASVILSVGNPSGLQGNNSVAFSSNEATAFDTLNHLSASTLFTSSHNLNAFHIRDNGNYLVSAQVAYTIDGVIYEDGEVAEFDPTTNSATSFVNFEDLLGEGDVDIDAISEHPDGRIAFSTLNAAEVVAGPNAGLSFTNKDVLLYDPTTMATSILFDGSQLSGTDSFINVSGVSLVDDRHIGLAVSTGSVTDTLIGGITFQRNDVVLYDLISGTATTLV